jgi:hypothetical protein
MSGKAGLKMRCKKLTSEVLIPAGNSLSTSVSTDIADDTLLPARIFRPLLSQ